MSGGPHGSIQYPLGPYPLGPCLPDLSDERGPLRVRRVWPAGREPECGLVVEAGGADGRLVAATVQDGRVRLLATDRRLPALDYWRARPGARLLAHRAGKRAVLRVDPHADDGHAGDGHRVVYVKLARAAATQRAALARDATRRQLSGAPQAPRLPQVLRVDAPSGLLVLAEMPGRALRDVLGHATSAGDPRRAEDAGAAVARAMTALATCGLPPQVGEHTLRDEARVLRRWVQDAVAHDVVRGQWRSRLLAACEDVTGRLDGLPSAERVLSHRDLHDGQVLVDTAGPSSDPAVGFLDLDTVAAADPALDLANLLAHLDLLATTSCAPRRAAAVHRFQAALSAALRAHAHPVVRDDPVRVEVLRAAARVRLAAVHAFRPQAPRSVPAVLGPQVLPAWPARQ